jgi:hypothetical protein
MARKDGKAMHDALILVGVLAGWLLLQLVVLPRLGFST